MLDGDQTTIPFSTEALKANLLRLQNEWQTVQASRDRGAIYRYLASVFELVTWWAKEGKAVKRAYRALGLRGYSSVREPEPLLQKSNLGADDLLFGRHGILQSPRRGAAQPRPAPRPASACDSPWETRTPPVGLNLS